MGSAVTKQSQRDLWWRDLVNALPAAIYATDASGRITFYNEAAAALWGCRPEIGKSEWCGSWKLYWPDGTPLPHDECPMAVALKTGPPRQRRGGRGRAARRHARAVHALSDAAARRLRQDHRRREHAGRSHRAHGRRAGARHLAAIVESSDDAIVSKTSTASSPAGTRARSGCSATRPTRSSASRSRSSFRRSATTRNLEFSRASGAASASITMRPFASARTAAWSKSR